MTSATTVTVNGISSYNCPAIVNKRNWLSDNRAVILALKDTFEITMNGDSVTATRIDGGAVGWCFHLSFYCCKGVFPIFKCSLLK